MACSFLCICLALIEYKLQSDSKDSVILIGYNSQPKQENSNLLTKFTDEHDKQLTENMSNFVVFNDMPEFKFEHNPQEQENIKEWIL